LQRELFADAQPSFDGDYAGLQRLALGAASWVDRAEGWVRGADVLFEIVLNSRSWGQRSRWMYDREVVEPRLTAPWSLESGEALEPALLEELRASLSTRYRVQFDSVGFNLYRDGRDSVAWHRDRFRDDVHRPTIALVSLGERRKLLLRPRGGGASRAFLLGRGDLFVLGGEGNLEWEHCVPKVRHASPRISLAFRHGTSYAASGS
jgi:alkylated DNA repair dioxygenase AlkB